MRAIAIAIAIAAAMPAQVAAAGPGFGFPPGAAGFSVSATESGGGPDDLAGSHPYALTTTVDFNRSEGSPAISDGDVKDIQVELPPGLIENANAVPRCAPSEFNSPRSSPYEASRSGESCADASQIGVVAIHTAAAPGGVRYFGIFNLDPPPGYPSQFGFSPFGSPIVFTPHVRQTDGEYGLTLVSRNISQLVDVAGIEMTIWGNPWSPAHDGRRGNCLNETEPASPFAQCPINLASQHHAAEAYLTLPSSCAGPLRFQLAADSWQAPGRRLPSGDPDLADTAWKTSEFQSPGNLKGCGELSFLPQASAQPTTESVSSPTGLGFHLETFQGGAALLSPGARLQSQIKRATVALPEGLTINPSVGAGLGVCTPAQYAAEAPSTAPGAACPNPSKIGTVTLETPLLDETLKGALFLAQPYQNPFGSPYGLYLVARSAERGFIVKVPGELSADARSGRLTATFDNLPQLPYSHLNVDFREGQRAPLVTPPACGIYTTQVALNPWIEPGAVLHLASNFKLTRGIRTGGACPPGGAAPFEPRASAGTLNSNAGSYSPFYLHLTRTDAEQEITSYSAQLPPGVLGRVAGIPFCPDVAIEAAKQMTGTAEAEHPSCPAASQIGHTVSGFGVGLALAYAPGRFYLAGPYHGQPLSVVAVDSALVGPFDLGTIVIRSAIHVDPRTAQVAVDSTDSDPIPHIVAGIPLHLRDVRVYMDRAGFTLNPTSCDPFSITSTLTGSDAPFTNPKDVVAAATVPYQAFNCSALGFAPKVALSLAGGARRGNYPALRVVVTPRAGDANIAAASVALPPSEFLAQAHIRTICTRAQSEADACPAEAVVGSARAETPLLAEPLEGPVYLRSSSGLLPDLVAVLHGGGGIRIVLEGHVDSFHGGLRGTFEGLPDAPVTRFAMTIFGGRKKGILVNSADLCAGPQIAAARLVGKNNLGEALAPRLGVKCPKHRKSRHGRRGAAR